MVILVLLLKTPHTHTGVFTYTDYTSAQGGGAIWTLNEVTTVHEPMRMSKVSVVPPQQVQQHNEGKCQSNTVCTGPEVRQIRGNTCAMQGQKVKQYAAYCYFIV